MIKIVIPGELTDLNEYIRNERGNRYAAANIKKHNTDFVAMQAKLQAKPIRTDKRLAMHCTHYCKDKRKDPDNVAFTKKFILDGLVAAGILEGDGWNRIGMFTDEFEVDKQNPRIVVRIRTIDE